MKVLCYSALKPTPSSPAQTASGISHGSTPMLPLQPARLRRSDGEGKNILPFNYLAILLLCYIAMLLFGCCGEEIASRKSVSQ